MFSYGNFTSLSMHGVELFALPLLFPAHLSHQKSDRKCMAYMDHSVRRRIGLEERVSVVGPSGARFDHEELPARYAGAVFEKAADLGMYFADAQYNPGIPSHISDITTVSYFLSKDTALRLHLIHDEALMFEDGIIAAIHGTAAKLIIDSVCALRSEEDLSRAKVAAFFAGEIFDTQPIMLEGAARHIQRAQSA